MSGEKLLSEARTGADALVQSWGLALQSEPRATRDGNGEGSRSLHRPGTFNYLNDKVSVRCT